MLLIYDNERFAEAIKIFINMKTKKKWKIG